MAAAFQLRIIALAITRNAVIVLYVLLECLKWISTLLSLALQIILKVLIVRH